MVERASPPPTGPMMVRLLDGQIGAIDAWIAKLDEDVSRPEAIRRLVEIGLKAKGIRVKVKPKSQA